MEIARCKLTPMFDWPQSFYIDANFTSERHGYDSQFTRMSQVEFQICHIHGGGQKRLTGSIDFNGHFGRWHFQKATQQQPSEPLAIMNLLRTSSRRKLPARRRSSSVKCVAISTCPATSTPNGTVQTWTLSAKASQSLRLGQLVSTTMLPSLKCQTLLDTQSASPLGLSGDPTNRRFSRPHIRHKPFADRKMS